MKKRNDRWSKIRNKMTQVVALLLAVFMIAEMPMSHLVYATEVQGEQTPTQAVEQELEQGPEQGPEPQAVRESIDWTNRKDALHLSLQRVIYQEADQTSIIVKNQNLICDLSAMNPDTLQSMRMEYGFEFLDLTKSGALQAGDTFTLTVPIQQWKLTDTLEPVEVWTCDPAQYLADGSTSSQGSVTVGSYVIQDNVVTVTCNEHVQTIEGSKLFGVIGVDVTLNKGALNPQSTTVTELITQMEDLQNQTKVSIVLPKLILQQEGKTEPKEQVEPQANDAPQVNHESKVHTPIPNHQNQDVRSKDTSLKPRNFVGRLLGKPVSRAGTTVDDFDRISYIEKKLNVEDPIQSGTIEVASNQDGYTKGDSNLSIRFQIKFALNDTYLNDVYEANVSKITAAPGYAEAMLDAPDGEKWMNFLNQLPDEILPSLRYSIDLNKNTPPMITIPNGMQKPEALLDDHKQELGTYQVEGNGKVTFTLNKSLYNSMGISAGAGFNLQVNPEALPTLPTDEKIDVGWDEKTNTMIGTTHVDGGGTGDPANDPYQVIKTAPSFVDTPYIDYSIRVQAPKGKQLHEMVFKDPIPTGLKLVSAKIGSTDLVTVDSTPEVINSFLEGTSFRYAFPKAGGNLTSAVFTIRLGISDYKDAALKSGKEFKNQASLYEPDGTTKKADSKEVTTKLQFQILEKAGVQNALDGTTYDWSVKVNTKFSSALESSYLVDRICIDAQRYEFDTLRIDGKSLGTVRTNAAIKDPVIEAGWTNINDTVLDQLSASVGGTATEPFYYEYTDSSVSPGKSYGVLIIPFNTYANKKAELTYQTKIIHQDIYDGTDWSTMDTGNDANFYYNKARSMGTVPGTPPDPDVIEIEKAPPVKVELGSKSAGTYEPDTQVFGWKFDVNHYAANITDFTITDTLDPTVYDLSSLKIGFVKETRDTSQAKAETGSLTAIADAAGRSYTINELGQMVIQIPNISSYEMYHMTLQAKICQASFLSAQGDQNFSNTAVMTGTANGHLTTNQATATKTLTNTLIRKSVEEGYNYATHKFTWKVVVNPNHVPIQNMKLTEILPEGNEWGQLLTVTQTKQGGKPVSGTISQTGSQSDISFTDGGKWIGAPEGDQTDAAGKLHKVEAFTRNNSDATTDSYTFIMETKVSDAYLTAQSPLGHTGSEEVSAVYSIPCSNEAKLDGTVYGTKIQASADVKAQAGIQDSLIAKHGTYLPEQGAVRWTVNVNTERLDLSGYQIVEDLDSVGAGKLMELVTEGAQAVQIYEASVKADGTVVRGTSVTDQFTLQPLLSGTPMEKGFQTAIPETLKGTPLQLVFYTQLLENCQLSDVKNLIKLKKDAVPTIQSEVEDGGNGGKFDLEYFVYNTPLPSILIQKTSINSDAIALPNIRFSLIKGTESSGIYTFSQAGKDRVTSDRTGFALYTRLIQNQVYEIKEDVASADLMGYQEAGVQYIQLSSDLGSTETKKIMVAVAEGTSTEQTLTILHPNEKGKYLDNIVSIKNTPQAGGTIRFTKQGTAPIPGTGVSVLSGATFTIVKDDDPKWKLGGETGNNTVTSDATGVVTFAHVDEGTYTITEDRTTEGYYITGGKLEAKVTKTGKVYTVSLTAKTDKEPYILTGNGESSTPYVVTDQLIQGSLHLKKVDGKTTTQGLAGAVFGLFQAQADAADSTKAVQTGTTDGTGALTFTGLKYGTYYLYEITPPTGYQKDPTLQATIEMTDGIKNTVTSGKSFAYEQGNITNLRVTGTMNLTKQNDQTTPQVLAGRTFYLTPTDPLTKAYLPAALGYYTSGVTDVNGACCFTDIPWGKYRLTEVRPSADDPYHTEGIQIQINEDKLPVVYEPAKPEGTFTYQIESSASTGIVTNTLLKTDLIINKTVLNQGGATWFDGDKLSGVEFTVSGKNFYGEEIKISPQRTTNGTLTFPNIPIGAINEVYTLTETRPAGYGAPADSNRWTFTVTVDNDASGEGKAVIGAFTAGSTAGTNTAVLDSATKTISITNKPIQGTITVTKKSATSVAALAGLDQLPFSGVHFALYAVNDQKQPTKAYEAVTDASGTATFNQVIYGQNYRLYEEALPEGYASESGVYEAGKGWFIREITGAQLLTGQTGTPDTFGTYSVGEVKNTLLTKQTSFQKLDADQQPLNGIEFLIYRRHGNEMTGVSGAGIQVAVPNATRTYYPYTPVIGGKVTSNASGDLTINDLPYGDYLLIEQNKPEVELQEHCAKVAIHIAITDSDQNGSAEITVKENENYEGLKDSNGSYTLEAAEIAGTSWKMIQPTNNRYPIINQLKYGKVQMHKVTANRNSTGLESTGHPESGAKFALYRGAQAIGTPYLTLTTDAQGMFAETEGVYTDTTDTRIKKHLFYGTYTIKEQSASVGVKVDPTPVTFAIGEATTGHNGTAWITNGACSYVKSKDPVPDRTSSHFNNEIIRTTLSLKKTGMSNVPLAGGEFVIKQSGETGKQAVAGLSEGASTAVDGIYQLSKTLPQGYTLVEKNATQEQYLFNVGTIDSPSYRLLIGTYTIEEVTAPKGYQKRSFQVTIGVDGTVSTEPSITQVTVSGTEITLSDLPIELHMYKKDLPHKEPISGAAFTLKGIFADALVQETEKALVSRADGMLTLADGTSLSGLVIEGNTYMLTEPAVPTGQPWLEKMGSPIQIKIGENGHISTANVTCTQPGVESKEVFSVAEGTDTITVYDKYIRNGVKLTKLETKTATPIKGAKFDLYRINGAMDTSGNVGTDPSDTKVCENIVTGVGGIWSSAGAPDSAVYTSHGQTWKVKEGLVYGSYYFIERDATDAYYNCNATKEFVIDGTSSTTPIAVTMENDPFRASLELTKLDQWNQAILEGMKFDLSKEMEPGAWKSLATITTNAQGVGSYTFSQKGHYRLTEQEHTGYEVKTAPKDNPYTADFIVGNEDQNQKLCIKKNDLSLTTFQYQETSETVKRGLLTESGIVNTRKPASLSVQKIDSATSAAPATEAEFQIYKNVNHTKGDLVATFETGKTYTGAASTEQLTYTFTSIPGTPGTLQVDRLPWGDYYLVESRAPEGYVLDTMEREFSVHGSQLQMAYVNGTAISNTKNTFELKKMEMGDLGQELTGAEFTIEKQQSDHSWKEVWNTSSLSSFSKWSLAGVLIGGARYRLTETKAPNGYEKLGQSVEFTMQTDGTAVLNQEESQFVRLGSDKKGMIVTNTPIEVDLQKVDAGTKVSLTGGSYTVEPAPGSAFAGTSQSPIAITDTAGNMKAALSGKLIAENSYLLTETTAPMGYELAAPVTFTVDTAGKVTIAKTSQSIASVLGGDTADCKIQLQDTPIQVKVNKIKQETGAKEALLSGAEFTVSPKAGSSFAKKGIEGTTPSEIRIISNNSDDLNGRFIAGNQYTITETQTPKGYIRLAEVITVTVKPDGTLELVTPTPKEASLDDHSTTVKVFNYPTTFYLDKVNNETKGRIAGATLEITKPDGTSLSPQRSWMSDGRDKGVITGLPAGTYKLVEQTTPYEYKKAEDIAFTLDNDNQITVAGDPQSVTKDPDGNWILTMTDSYIRGQVKLEKTMIDADVSQKKTPLAGAVFTLYKQKGAAPAPQTDTKLAEQITTLADGTWTTEGNTTLRIDNRESLSKGLEEGKYYLMETATTANALLDTTTPQAFTIGVEDHLKVKGVKAENQEFTASIHMHKQEDVKHKKTGIQGAVFELWYTPEGSSQAPVKLSKTMVTDLQGDVTVGDLKKGAYTLKEITNQGYESTGFLDCSFVIKDKDYRKVLEINSENKDITLVEAQASKGALTTDGIVNTRILGSMTLLKVDGKDTEKQLKDTQFKLMKQDQPNTFMEWLQNLLTGKKYQVTDTISGEEVLAEEGRLTVSGLEWGTYKLVETRAAAGYENHKQELTFDITREKQDIILKTDGHDIFNFQNEWILKKQNAQKDPLSGAVFTITKEGDASPTATVTTGDGTAGTKKGEVKLTGELVGGTTYILHETVAPDGYILPEGKSQDIKFTVEENGTITVAGALMKEDRITITDLPIEIKLKKVDGTDPQKLLSNAEFHLTDQANPSKTITLISTKKGIILPNMIQGHTYTLEETKAPEGYYLPKDHKSVTFQVETNGTVTFMNAGSTTGVISGTGSDTIRIANHPIQVGIQKQNPKGELLTGWEFEVKGFFALADGTIDQTAGTITVDEQHLDALEGKLVSGEIYTIQETKEPSGYTKLTEKIKVKALENGTLELQAEPGITSAAVLSDTKKIVRITNLPTEFKLDKVSNETDANGQVIRPSGAVLEIRDTTGKTVATFTSDGMTQGTISGLPKGIYTLVETITPVGYLPAEPIPFELKEDNSLLLLGPNHEGRIEKGSDGKDILIMTDVYTRGDIVIQKLKNVMESCADPTLGVPSKDHAEPAAGAVFALYSDEEGKIPVKDKNGITMTAVSGANGRTVFQQLPMGTYYIRELQAPKGCVLDHSIYKGVINGAGVYEGLIKKDTPLAQNQIVNDVYRTKISIKKVSENFPDMTMPDSVYGLYKLTSKVPVMPKLFKRANRSFGINPVKEQPVSEDKNPWTLIAKAKTDVNGALVFDGILMDTEYVIRELEAPAGSQISEKPITIQFTVDEQNHPVIQQFDMGNGTAELDPGTGEIIWKEPSVIVGFSKKDTKGAMLRGAKLQLQDVKGMILKEWISTDVPYILYGDQMDGKLKTGETYRLVETEAPKGYGIAQPVEFIVEEKLIGPGEKFIQSVDMVDELLPVVSQTLGESGNQAAKTGDSDHPMIYIITMVLACMGILLLVIWQKKKKE